MKPKPVTVCRFITVELAVAFYALLNAYDVSYRGPKNAPCPKRGNWINEYISLN